MLGRLELQLLVEIRIVLMNIIANLRVVRQIESNNQRADDEVKDADSQMTRRDYS